MSKPKKERNQLIVRLKDKKKWSYEMIRKEMGFKARSTVHEIYHREKIVRGTVDNST
jgi:hypothetical protein